MKKHDEGYALLLVVVVMVVLSIVSAGLLSGAAANAKSQKASIDRMVDKYAAQGEIEMVVAKLSQEASGDKDAGKEIKDQLVDWVYAQSGVAPDDVTVKNGKYACTVSLTAESGTAVIECELALSGTVTEETGEQPLVNSTYEIKPDEVIYIKYVISRTSEGGGG